MSQDVDSRTSINNFASVHDADNVPTGDHVFRLTSTELRCLLKEATDPLMDRIQVLEHQVDGLSKDIEALKKDEKLDHDDIRDLFDAIACLEQSNIQPMQKDRGEMLRALIAANGGKMLAKDARQKMHLGKEQFSLLLSKTGDFIEKKPLNQDKRRLVLIIK